MTDRQPYDPLYEDPLFDDLPSDRSGRGLKIGLAAGVLILLTIAIVAWFMWLGQHQQGVHAANTVTDADPVGVRAMTIP